MYTDTISKQKINLPPASLSASESDSTGLCFFQPIQQSRSRVVSEEDIWGECNLCLGVTTVSSQAGRGNTL
jgi:hypothetical protein